jgi:hypothetical protein
MPAWNKGLKKETDHRVAAYAQTISILIRDSVKQGTFVPNKAGPAARKVISERMSRENPGGRCLWYTVDEEKVQGTWERDLALKMVHLQIKWTKRRQSSLIYHDLFNNIRRYTPDFFLPEYDMFLELKGYWWGSDKEKMKLVFEQHPNHRIITIENEFFKLLLQATSKQQFISLLQHPLVAQR